MFRSCGNPVLIDFGNAVFVNLFGETKRPNGTLLFHSPESLDDSPEFDVFQNDVWALGVCFYPFAYLKLPFGGNSMADLLKSIQCDELDYESGV